MSHTVDSKIKLLPLEGFFFVTYSHLKLCKIKLTQVFGCVSAFHRRGDKCQKRSILEATGRAPPTLIRLIISAAGS